MPGSRYSWWVPLLASLKEAVVTRKYRRIAVVGVPCVARATQTIRASDHELLRPYAKAIRLVIGLFCTETFDYAKLVEGKLQSERRIEPWDIRRLDIKGKLDVYLQDERHISIPLAELEESVRPGCRVCTDFTAVEADVSAGAVGSPEGYTTLVIRNDIGRGVRRPGGLAGETCDRRQRRPSLQSSAWRRRKQSARRNNTFFWRRFGIGTFYLILLTLQG